MAAIRRNTALVALAIAIASPLLTSRADPTEPGWRYDTATKKLTELGVPDGQTPWILNCTLSQGSKLTISSVAQTGTNGTVDLERPIVSDGETAFELVAIGGFSNNNAIRALRLPDTMTAISASAFNSCNYLESVKLPSRLTTLGNSAFYSCVRLRTLENFLPATLASLGFNAFRYCSRISSPLTMGHGLDGNQTPITLTIGTDVFSGATDLPCATIGPGVTAIPTKAFINCSSLRTVTLHEGIVSIGENAFQGCTDLANVAPLTPSALTSLGAYAYSGCSELSGEAVLGENGPCSIGRDAFSSTRITRLVLGPGVTGELPSNLCGYCGLLTSVTLEGALSGIGSFAFRDCSSLETMRIPDSVSSIGQYAFYRCYALRSVHLPAALASIGGAVFSGCESLETVEPLFPAGCTSVGSGAFGDCSKLSGELFLATNGAPATIGDKAFTGTKITSATIGDGVSRIEASTFSSCTALRSLRLPAGLTHVGNYAFMNCSELETIEPLLPAGCTNVGSSAFSSLKKLTGDLFVATNGAPAAIGDSAFGSTKIDSATLGDGVTTIGASCFSSCTSLQTVRLPAGLTSIGNSAFLNCTALETAIPLLPFGCTSVGSDVFKGCSSLAGTLAIDGDGAAVTLGSAAFSGTRITDVSFCAGVSAIPANFLQNVPTLRDVIFASKPTWTSSSFSGPANYAARLVVPADDPDWTTFVSTPASATPWDDLAASVQQAYFDAFPGEPPPRALTKTAPANQWIVSYGTTPAGECDLVVAGLPVPLAAEQVSPAYGTYANIATTPGLPMTLSAPPFASEPLVRYRCAGYRIEEPSPAGWANAVDYGLSDPSAPSVSYMPDGDGQRRFSWLWEPVGYAVTIVPPPDASIGTVSVAGADASGYFTPGSTAVATATSAATFTRWIGDVPEGHETDNPLSLVMDGPKTIMPEFASEWVYDSVAKTVTDGYWTLGVTGSRDALTVGAPKSGGVSPGGVLDLRKPIAGGGAFVATASSAFSGSKALIALRLPDTMASLGWASFKDCKSLKTVYPLLPASVTSVADYCFSGCTALEGDLTFATNGLAATLGQSGFAGTAIASVTLGDGVTAINNHTFESCPSLGRVKMGESVTSIASRAFFGCSSLTNVTPLLPASTASVGDASFQSCPLLEGDLFFATNGASASFTGSGSAFSGVRIRSAVIGNGVTAIPKNTFKDCSSLGRVEVGENVSLLGESCFSGCSSLTNFTPLLPAATVEVGYGCFWYCSSLSGDLFFATNGAPARLLNNGSNFRGTGISSATLGDGVTAIPDSAFSGCKQLRFVRTGETLETIGATIFGSSCRNLTDFIPLLPAAITSVGASAFTDTAALTGTLTIGMGRRDVSFAPSQQFRATSITNLVLGPRFIAMSSGAFQSTTLQSITINSTPAISDNAFKDCKTVRKVVFTGTIPETMPASAFSGWTTGQSSLYVPKDDAAWLDWVQANVRPWNDLTDDERDGYWDLCPRGRKPFGMTKSTSVPANQYVVGFVPPGRGTIFIMH